MKKVLTSLAIFLCLAFTLVLTSCDLSELNITWNIDPHNHASDTNCEVPAPCSDCGIEIQVLEHEPEKDDGDCTTPVKCTICKEVLVPAFSEHVLVEDDADCTTPITCVNCDEVFVNAKEHRFTSEWISDDEGHHRTCRNENCEVANEHTPHTLENFMCTVCEKHFPIDAREMTAEELNVSVTAHLSTGNTDIYVLLLEDASAEMLTAVRRAFVDTPYVSPGSIKLTLAGVTVIADHGSEAVAFGQVKSEIESLSEDQTVTTAEYVYALGSISLPDVVYIGSHAFDRCVNLTEVSAPKAEIIGEWAFSHTELFSVELPEATVIGYAAFLGSQDLTTVVLNKALEIGAMAFDNTSINSLTLLAEGEIVIEASSLGYPNTESGNIDLVLNSVKEEEVMDNSWNGFEFKSVTFAE